MSCLITAALADLGILFEPEKAGARITLRHFDKQIDIRPQFLR